MTTMAQAIRAYVESAGGKVTAEEIKRHINTEFPDRWKPRTLQALLYSCTVNNPKAYIHPGPACTLGNLANLGTCAPGAVWVERFSVAPDDGGPGRTSDGGQRSDSSG